MERIESDISTILRAVDQLADSGDNSAIQARAEIQATRHGTTPEEIEHFNQVVRAIASKLNIRS